MIIVVERESSIQISLNESIGKVNPFVLGQFIEHFPRQIYGGIYEEGSPYSDSKGYRLDIEKGNNIRCATSWKDVQAFKDLLVNRLVKS
ncbi:unnamed protein product [marine sediment metagenome]|uniref:Uncharacterized protein n=1 Tax=marine sediment metagenome TaxID=412755 RepID=X1AFK7_9ZZZZ